MFPELPTKALCRRCLTGLICARRIHVLHQIFSKVPHPHIQDLPLKTISDIKLASCILASSATNQRLSRATLSDLLDRIQPFRYMHFKLPAGVENIRFEDASRYRYSIKEFQPLKRKSSPVAKRRGKSKEIHITTSLHPDAFKHKLRTACGLLEQGMRVEFHLRAASGETKLTVDWALRNLPYLRPDVILRSMPEGTALIVPPMENKAREELIWAVSKIGVDRSVMNPKRKRKKKDRDSIIPRYATAVERSQRLEPHRWQGFRDDDSELQPWRANEDGNCSDEEGSRSLENRTDEATTGLFRKIITPPRLVNSRNPATKT